jgi:hypothetical protein
MKHKVAALLALLAAVFFVFAEYLAHHNTVTTNEVMFVNAFILCAFLLMLLSRAVPRIIQIAICFISSVAILVSMWIFIPHVCGSLLADNRAVECETSSWDISLMTIYNCKTMGDECAEGTIGDAYRLYDLALHQMIIGEYGKGDTREYCDDLRLRGRFGVTVDRTIDDKCLAIYKVNKMKATQFNCLNYRQNSDTKEVYNELAGIEEVVEMMSDNFWNDQRLDLLYIAIRCTCRLGKWEMFEKYSSYYKENVAAGDLCLPPGYAANLDRLLSWCYEEFGHRWMATKHKSTAMSLMLDQREIERSFRKLFWTGESPDRVHGLGWSL